MKIKWITQAGLTMEADGKKIIIDPYLSDSCERLNPLSKRRMPIDQAVLNDKYDIVIFTHNHLDHTDPDTYPIILNKEHSKLVIAPWSSYLTVRELKGNNNYVSFRPGTVWTEGNIKFTSIKAEHSDLDAIGVLIEYEGKKYYVTGDTLYNKEVVESAPKNADYVFVPVNGVGNNMNMTDAAQFATDIGAKHVVPFHVGLFDSHTPDEFEHERRLILEVYKEYDL